MSTWLFQLLQNEFEVRPLANFLGSYSTNEVGTNLEVTEEGSRQTGAEGSFTYLLASINGDIFAFEVLTDNRRFNVEYINGCHNSVLLGY
jgi:hypothetical protein